MYALNPVTICTYCGNTLEGKEQAKPYTDDGEIEGQGSVICYECYHDDFEFHCCNCPNYEHIREQETMLVVFDPEAAGLSESMILGVYEILKLPYFTSGYIGRSWLHENALAYLGPLPPKADGDGFPCGHLCFDCQAPYIVVGDEAE